MEQVTFKRKVCLNMNRLLFSFIISGLLLQDVSKIFVQDSESWRTQANTYFMISKDYEKAIYAYTKAIEIEPKESDLYLLRGICYFNIDKFTKAIEDVTKAIELSLTPAREYGVRAQLYHVKGDLEKATADYIRAARLGNKDAQEKLKKAGIKW